MRKYLFLIMILGLMAPAIAQNAPSSDKKNGAIITFDKQTHEFGDIMQGDKVEHTFYFTNTGNEPLIITNVQVQCGCTTPKGYPREPIEKGGKGELTISFNSAGKMGRQNKTVTVISNAINPEGNQLSFTTNVLPKSTPAQ
jgi:hypothetical protein